MPSCSVRSSLEHVQATVDGDVCPYHVACIFSTRNETTRTTSFGVPSHPTGVYELVYVLNGV